MKTKTFFLVCDERETIERSFSHTNDEVITEVRSNSLLSISEEMFAGSRCSGKAEQQMRNAEKVYGLDNS